MKHLKLFENIDIDNLEEDWEEEPENKMVDKIEQLYKS